MKSMVTCFPSPARAAAISEPMKPPPMMVKRAATLSQRAQALVIGQRAEVDDLFARSGQANGVTAGGQQQALVGVLLAQVIHQAAAQRVEVRSRSG